MQDQLVIQIIALIDQLWKKENLDLKLTPYRVLATKSATSCRVMTSISHFQQYRAGFG